MKTQFKTILISTFCLFLGTQVYAQSSCSNIANRARNNTGQNHVFGNQPFGQTILADPACLGGNTFSTFSFSSQGNSPTKFDIAIYEGEVIPTITAGSLSPAPRYLQTNIRNKPTNRGGNLIVDLKEAKSGASISATYSDRSLEANKYYTFVVIIARSGGGNLIAHTSPDATPGKAFFKGTAYPGSDLVFEVKAEQEASCPQNIIDDFYAEYDGKSKFVSHYQKAIETFICAEEMVKAEDYAGAKVLLDALWAEYPIANSVWTATDNTKTANGSWNGSPVAYAGLRMLTTIVEHQLTNPYPNYDAHTINMKVVLVGQTTGTMPKKPEDFGQGTGEANHTVTLDPRVTANDHEELKDNLYVFNQYITAITDGRLKVDVEFISLPALTYQAEVIVDGRNIIKIANGNLAALNALSQEVKDDADMWWIIYPSFTPGTGTQNQAVASHSAFPGQSFVTGGMDKDGRNRPVFLSDDLFLLDRQPEFNKRTLTEVERRCYPPEWFQHEFFHHLFKLFPTFEFESVSHKWQFPDLYPHPADFVVVDEEDFFQDAIDKRFKLVTESPLHERLKRRVETLPASLLASLSSSEFVGHYVKHETNFYNGYEKGDIVIENGVYKWITNNGQHSVVLDMSTIPNGYLTYTGYPYDFEVLLKIDENTGAYLPEVSGINIGGAIFVKEP